MPIGIPLGLVTANATEWLMHKHVLHGLGRNRDSYWGFHWHEHHRKVRRLGHIDPAYQGHPFRANAQGKEAAALLGAAVAVSPLFVVAPFFTGTLWYCVANYYVKHRRSHRDPEWAREHLPWHYDHHMGPNQNSNWCVTKPWFDILLGTREKYVGTDAELHERERRMRVVTASDPVNVSELAGARASATLCS